MSPAERYAGATREQLLAIAAAADACWQVEAEFGHPLWEHIDALDRALLHCPGTSAFQHHAKTIKLLGETNCWEEEQA